MSILFLLCPLLLGLPIPKTMKLASIGLTLLYGAMTAYKLGLFKFSASHTLSSSHLKIIAARFCTFALLSTLGMWIYAPDNLFYVVINHPKLWITMSLVYTFVSVIPQEFFYRSFFFKRYESLLSQKNGFIVFLAINAVLFCFAHFFFHNTLVYILTFCGGIIFTLSYKKHRSLWLVSIEHSAYGLWLFTIGMGDMLAFPGSPT